MSSASVKRPWSLFRSAIRQKVAFQDGAVELRFKLSDGDDLGLDFIDRELKTVHAGYLCIARVTLKRLTLTDSMAGAMEGRRQQGRPESHSGISGHESA